MKKFSSSLVILLLSTCSPASAMFNKKFLKAFTKFTKATPQVFLQKRQNILSVRNYNTKSADTSISSERSKADAKKLEDSLIKHFIRSDNPYWLKTTKGRLFLIYKEFLPSWDGTGIRGRNHCANALFHLSQTPGSTYGHSDSFKNSVYPMIVELIAREQLEGAKINNEGKLTNAQDMKEYWNHTRKKITEYYENLQKPWIFGNILEQLERAFLERYIEVNFLSGDHYDYAGQCEAEAQNEYFYKKLREVSRTHADSIIETAEHIIMLKDYFNDLKVVTSLQDKLEDDVFRKMNELMEIRNAKLAPNTK